ncbi:MAG TPA: DNA polymerase III subunit beta [Anaerolineae bacterium]
MRLSVLQENLAKGLSIVGRAVSTRSTLPVLGNILLSTDEGRLKLAATNLEIGVSCWLGAQVEDDGAITLPARLLTDWVNSMPPARIDMEMVVRSMKLNLKCARSESNINGIDASEFPLIPAADGEKSLRLAPAALRQMIEQVVFAASTDESRPALTGVLAKLEGDRMLLAATDGYRLSVRRMMLPAAVPEDVTMIVPARSLQEVGRIGAEADPEREIEICVASARNQILFRMTGKSEGEHGAFHQVDLVSQLIDARFPDYNAIIPKNFTTRTTVDTAAFLKAVKVAFLFARDVANNVRLQITPGTGTEPGKITLRANSAEVGDNISEVDATLVEGSGVEIAFNARYLIDVLSAIDTPQIVIETTSSMRPGVFRPVGTGSDEFTHVIMPMQLTR